MSVFEKKLKHAAQRTTKSSTQATIGSLGDKGACPSEQTSAFTDWTPEPDW